jgi:SRSO17 transposase
MAAGHSITPARWQETLDELLSRIAGRFTRVEPRRRARAFVRGLLASLSRTNCWTLAEHAGDATPDGMQHLLARAVWDADAVRDDVRDYLLEHLGDTHAVLVPATAGVDRPGPQDLGQGGPGRGGVVTVEDGVGAVDHAPSFLWPDLL